MLDNSSSADRGRFPLQGSETGRMILDFDWASTPLGPIEYWAAGLKSVVALMMHSSVPMVMLWVQRHDL